jgi:hypothetical protein
VYFLNFQGRMKIPRGRDKIIIIIFVKRVKVEQQILILAQCQSAVLSNKVK